MILLDIDQFSVFNAYQGHQEGDEKLKELATLICQAAEGASVFRSGGEEFVIFLSGLQMAEVVSAATRIRDVSNQHFLSLQSSLTVSCGVAFYPAHGKSFIDLREAADKAMYEGGKRLNRGVLVVAEFKS